jgi:hypothetical protein
MVKPQSAEIWRIRGCQRSIGVEAFLDLGGRSSEAGASETHASVRIFNRCLINGMDYWRSSYCTHTAYHSNILINNGAGEGNRTLVWRIVV